MLRACVCGETFEIGSSERNQRKWCSESCRVRQYRPRKGRTPRQCGVCQEVFPAWPTQKWCSDRCQWAAARARRGLAQEFVCADRGAAFSRTPARGQRPKRCASCRRRRRSFRKIPPSVRLFVFERDGWVCQLCEKPVDTDAPPQSEWSPTLDHVVCRTDGGDDSPENLRLAHHWCNSIRSEESVYRNADFVSAVA